MTVCDTSLPAVVSRTTYGMGNTAVHALVACLPPTRRAAQIRALDAVE